MTVSPQVYGGQSSEKATETGLFKNTSCTFMQGVVALFTVGIILSGISRAEAQTISNDRGGHVIVYALKVAKIRQSGEQVRITGRCDSACTLYLGLPAGQICVTRNASFGFHKPYGASQKANRQAEAHLMRNYPQWVRTWIAGRGGLSGKIITMNYSTAAKHIRRCG